MKRFEILHWKIEVVLFSSSSQLILFELENKTWRLGMGYDLDHVGGRTHIDPTIS